MPHESERNWICAGWVCKVKCLKTASAMGERQMLPRQTKRTDTVRDSEEFAMLARLFDCRVLRVMFVAER